MAAKKTAFFALYAILSWGEYFCLAEGLDKERYISIDEIRPGMKAYCLTCYKGNKAEKFDLEVIDVVRKLNPSGGGWGSRDAILVQGTDDRFIHSGPVGGCSGSPVYIEGRMAGALAFGWIFSKDPLYGVTPIEEMLKTGQSQGGKEEQVQSGEKRVFFQPGFGFDFSCPIDFDKIDKQIVQGGTSSRKSSGASALSVPLVISGLPTEVCEQLNETIGPLGLMAVATGGGGADTEMDPCTAKLEPGSPLAVPLVTGDIKADVIGTVTEVIGDRVYAFGHGFLGYGPVNLPMAAAKVHTVVSSTYRSFKFASAGRIVGALTTDGATGVCGQIGAKAVMIPLTITVDRYNELAKKVYNCEIVDNKLLTPIILRAVTAGAALFSGQLPPEHTIRYRATIETDSYGSVSFRNTSTNLGVEEMIREEGGVVALLWNNPYKKVNIKSIAIDISIVPENTSARIWSAELSGSTVKAGESVEINVVVESFLADKKQYQCSIKIPDELAAGKYELIVCGAYDYLQFVNRTAPYRFVPQNIESLIEIMNSILGVERDGLYCLLVLPAAGVAVEGAELPELPATKAVVMQDAARTLRIQPYGRWTEKRLKTGTVILDSKTMHITVEK